MKVNLQHTFKVGDILTVANGEYSDFTYIGPFKVIKEFTTQEVSEIYAARPDTEEEVDDYHYFRDPITGKFKSVIRGKRMLKTEHNCPEDFHAWLVKEGYAEAMDCIEWHVGNYGRFQP